METLTSVVGIFRGGTIVCCRALRGEPLSPLQSVLWHELRAPELGGHDGPPSRVFQPRDGSLLHHDDEQRGCDVLGLSCGARQLSSTSTLPP